MVVGGMKAIRLIKLSYFTFCEDGFFNLVIEERPNLQLRLIAKVRSYECPQQNGSLVRSPRKGREFIKLLMYNVFVVYFFPIMKINFSKDFFNNN